MSEEQEKIVLENEKLIYVILKKYNLYAQHEELYDLGMIGLCKGAKTFDDTKKIKLSTYLTKCIANEIFGYLRKKRPFTVSYEIEINREFGIDKTLKDTIKDESIDILNDLIKKNDFERVNQVINSLSKSEKIIINHLFNINGYKKMTQKELAAYLNVSQVQISRTKNKLISKIREQLKR